MRSRSASPSAQGVGFRRETGPLKAVHLSRHKWPGGLVSSSLKAAAEREETTQMPFKTFVLKMVPSQGQKLALTRFWPDGDADSDECERDRHCYLPMVQGLQRYLAHKKPPPPRGPLQAPRHGPTVGSYGVGVSYGRGTPVADHDRHRYLLRV